ncbi:hypothetical protein EXIGLDRAFT_778306 [Exidia glandulosa HHB12029]|uniref:BTB domain-containing protein n=1 Tax=Exidia glandulosa HHB12029 TaxID=1314781 RepID=A0A165CL26_EXIGL|nr:hypothetical protein EXIGLDRAFT_778306 [Exidia glandulosa HHB12029]
MLDKYTIILRGEPFTLYGDQIEFDGPNYFTNLFLGDFAESQTRVVELSRSPLLFRILVEYMSGYEVLPLQPASIPPTMSLEMALQNLERTASSVFSVVSKEKPQYVVHLLTLERSGTLV